MRVSEINLYRVRMPLIEPWVTAYGSQEHIESLFVNIKSGGVSGWGECSPAPLPLYNSEHTRGAYLIARDVLAPELIGKDITSGQTLQELLRQFKGNEFSKSAFDNAWWDAYAISLRKPLWKVIGGKTPFIEVGADIPVQNTNQELIQRVSTAVNQGFKRVKLKFNRNCSFEMIVSLREKFPDLLIHIDCNSGFSFDDMELFRELDQLNLTMIEQPFAYDDLIYHSRLQSELQTPICLDESITSIDRAKKAIEIGACKWINIKTSRVGGLTNAIEIHDLCKSKEIPVWVGGMLESAVGQGASIALATKDNVMYPSDIFPSDRFFRVDLSEPDINLEGKSSIRASETSGIGYKPKMKMLLNQSIEKDQISLNQHINY